MNGFKVHGSLRASNTCLVKIIGALIICYEPKLFLSYRGAVLKQISMLRMFFCVSKITC